MAIAIVNLREIDPERYANGQLAQYVGVLHRDIKGMIAQPEQTDIPWLEQSLEELESIYPEDPFVTLGYLFLAKQQDEDTIDDLIAVQQLRHDYRIRRSAHQLYVFYLATYTHRIDEEFIATAMSDALTCAPGEDTTALCIAIGELYPKLNGVDERLEQEISDDESAEETYAPVIQRDFSPKPQESLAGPAERFTLEATDEGRWITPTPTEKDMLESIILGEEDVDREWFENLTPERGGEYTDLLYALASMCEGEDMSAFLRPRRGRDRPGLLAHVLYLGHAMLYGDAFVIEAIEEALADSARTDNPLLAYNILIACHDACTQSSVKPRDNFRIRSLLKDVQRLLKTIPKDLI